MTEAAVRAALQAAEPALGSVSPRARREASLVWVAAPRRAAARPSRAVALRALLRAPSRAVVPQAVTPRAVTPRAVTPRVATAERSQSLRTTAHQ